MTLRFLSSTTISDGLPSARRAVAVAILALAGATAAHAAPDAASAAAGDQAAPLTITVRPGQSLNDIAVAVTQSHDPAVLARAGRALFDANPQAFMKRDPSRLKIGAQLTVPALDATGAAAGVADPAGAAAGGALASAALAASHAAASAGSAGSAAAASHPVATSAASHVAAASGATSLAALAASGAAGSASTVNGESAPGAASAHASSAAAQAAAPAASSGVASAHVWSGSIQQAPAGANGASAAGAEALLAPGAANQMPSGSATQAATGASQARPSSLQQLLALKNRVLMELQKHGIGKPAANLAPPPAPAAGSAQKSQAGAEAGAATSAVAGSETAGSETAGSEAAVGSAAGPATNAASAPAVTSPASVSPRATAPQAPFNMGAAIAVGAAVVALIAGFALRRRKKGPSADAIEPGAFTPAPALDPDAVAAIAGAPAEPEAAEKTHEAGEQGANAAARHALPIVPPVETDKASAKGESMLSSAAGPDLEPAREPHARAAEPLTLKMPQADEPGSAPFAAKSAAESAAEAGVPPTGAKPAPYAWRQAFPRDAIAALDSLDMPLPPRESAPDDIGQEVQSQPVEPAGSNASQDATNGQADAHRPIGAEAPREAGALGEAKPVADRNEGEPFDDEMHAARPWVAEPLHATPPGGIEPGEAVARAAESSAIEPLGEAARGQDARSTEPRSFATEAGSTHSAGQQAARAEATEPQAPTPIGAAPDVHERAHEQAHAQRQAGAVPQQAAVPHEAAVPGIELPNAPLTAHVEPPPAAAQPGAAFAAPAPVPASSSSEPAREPAAPSQSPSPNLPPLGVAQFGALNLDFDLELPAGPSASLPAFTPEALAKIARNKLELASEYVELGDLAGARTLLHEVIEAGHADTRDEARVMLAKLADLS